MYLCIYAFIYVYLRVCYVLDDAYVVYSLCCLCVWLQISHIIFLTNVQMEDLTGISLLQQYEQHLKLDIRFYLMDNTFDIAADVPPQTVDKLKFIGIKLFTDGSLGMCCTRLI